MEKTKTNEIKITFCTTERDVNTYVATYIHQQLRGNPNYIDSSIVLNMEQNDKTILYLIPDDTMDMTQIPNIAIDWNGIERIIISNLDEETKARIIKSLKDSYYDYPDIDNFDMLINDLHPGKIIVTANAPHIVFDLHNWIVDPNKEDEKKGN
jgi:hypothetical protein